MLSLLFKYPEEITSIGCSKELCLDQIVTRICRNKNLSDYVLTVLKQPLQNVANIVYRQEILRDFTANNKLYEELQAACEEYNKLRGEWSKAISRLRTRSGRMQFDAQNLNMIRDSVYTLETNALFCLNITSFPEVLLDILNKYHLKSEGLRNIKEFCRTRLEDENYIRLREIAQELSGIVLILENGCEITVDLCDSLRAQAAHLIRIKTSNPEQNVPRQRSFFASRFNPKNEKTEADNIDNTVSFSAIRDTRGEMVALIAEALREVSSILSQLTRMLYPTFAGLAEELKFYDFALRLYDIYKEERVSACFPDIKQEADDIFYAEELYDLLLVTKAYFTPRFKQEVIPNDVELLNQTSGILIQGDHSSGKTTFLRAIGVAQVFAQAGLPISCKSAKISIRRRVLAHFSSEDVLDIHDSAGRFEGEVKEIAALIDKLEPYSLILLNETFQTTAFDEAADAMFDILDVISEVNIKWIFVTHLLQLTKMFSDTRKQVLLLKTCNDEENLYKLKVMDNVI